LANTLASSAQDARKARASPRSEHPKVVRSLLGHSSITQKMDTYSHLLEDLGGDAVGGLDEAFGS
jgi:hypothetical protein